MMTILRATILLLALTHAVLCQTTTAVPTTTAGAILTTAASTTAAAPLTSAVPVTSGVPVTTVIQVPSAVPVTTEVAVTTAAPVTTTAAPLTTTAAPLTTAAVLPVTTVTNAPVMTTEMPTTAVPATTSLILTTIVPVTTAVAPIVTVGVQGNQTNSMTNISTTNVTSAPQPTALYFSMIIRAVLNTTLSAFNDAQFQSAVASVVNVDPSMVRIVNKYAGSVIVNFQLAGPTQAAADNNANQFVALAPSNSQFNAVYPVQTVGIAPIQGSTQLTIGATLLLSALAAMLFVA